MQQGILTPEQYQDLTKKIIHSIETRYRINNLFGQILVLLGS